MKTFKVTWLDFVTGKPQVIETKNIMKALEIARQALQEMGQNVQIKRS